ncbi:MAG: YdcH family protein [Pseudomonadota bacterium]
MSHVPHELGEEFPEHAETMHRLKLEDAHFVNLAEKYHEVNRAVHRAETDIEPTSDEHMTEMRKQRAYLKDEIAAILAKHA